MVANAKLLSIEGTLTDDGTGVKYKYNWENITDPTVKGTWTSDPVEGGTDPILTFTENYPGEDLVEFA